VTHTATLEFNMPDKVHVLDANARDFLRTYIDGKMQRYYLLFAVNGGAFGIAELMRNEHGVVDPLGNLSLPRLAFGAVIFTWLMWWDIWNWGEMMRQGRPESPGDAPQPGPPLRVFTPAGKAILTLLTTLLTLAWFMAASDIVVVVSSGVTLLALFMAYRVYKWRADRRDSDLTSGCT
jgi:hypothetical protein